MLNTVDSLQRATDRITNIDHVLGKGLVQPHASMNSASRKILYSTQQDHIMPPIKGEVPLNGTGYENEFGRHSSSFVLADANYELVHKIPKFTHMPGYVYLAVLRNLETGEYTVRERKQTEHITENYGFMYNNEDLDELYIGGVLEKGKAISKSISYDQYNNRQDGINLLSGYLADPMTTEDGIKLSMSGAAKLSSALVKPVSINVNGNHIMLNLYGNEQRYKAFPDIGESVSGGLLCALRIEKKEEILYTLSSQRLQHIMISDEKYTVGGMVVDIDICCNNPEALADSHYNGQLKYYYDEIMAYSRNIVNTLSDYIDEKCSYDLKKMYLNHKRRVDGDLWAKDGKPFSDTVVEFTLLEISDLSVGDKIADRYGGKGVTSCIVPDNMMPRLEDGRIMEVIFNPIGPVGRENPGQLIELTINHVGDEILKMVRLSEDPQDGLNMILDFIRIVVPKQYEYYRNLISGLDRFEKDMLLDSFVEYGIVVHGEPISEACDIDTLDELYRVFPWIQQSRIEVPIIDSNNQVRFVPARRRITVAKKFMHRLKQYAKDKSSATSLSATSLRNVPTKPRSNKLYKAPFAKTPIKMGFMEMGNLMHFLNMEVVVSNLMIHSNSPIARKKCKELLTENPFNIDIKLDPESRNRDVEILNAYLKTMGLRLVFKRKRKDIAIPFFFEPFTLAQDTEGLVRAPFVIDDGKPVEPFYFDVDPDTGRLIPFYFEPFRIASWGR